MDLNAGLGALVSKWGPGAVADSLEWITDTEFGVQTGPCRASLGMGVTCHEYSVRGGTPCRRCRVAALVAEIRKGLDL